MHSVRVYFVLVAVLGSHTSLQPGTCAELPAVVLPPGIRAIWDLEQAYHETTPTRERVCLNGLWQWQPAEPNAEAVPAADWGYFKVPGSWPGITDYMQKDCQTVRPHPSWQSRQLSSLTAAWYRRQFTVPKSWAGRSVAVHLEYLNSFAAVYVDGRKAGELRFPGGDLDLTAACQPGTAHDLSLLVVALPLKGVLLSYTDSASARQVKGAVPRRGLCGDVFLVSQPAAARLRDVSVETSVRRKQLTVNASCDSLNSNADYRLQVKILKDDRVLKEFTSKPFRANEIPDGRIALTENWMPDQLWDLHTPQNTIQLAAALLDDGGQVLDAALPQRFGFREFWIEGRDFFLNGSRIYLSAVPLDNAQVSAALSTYAAARESLERLKSIGINFVYAHNYDCLPGSHLAFAEILRAADDAGMLVALTQPHFSHYEWPPPGAAPSPDNGYATHARFYVRVAGSHPSVVLYSMSHNATGYNEDMNPDLIDGIHAPRDQWASRNVELAKRAEAIVRSLDPTRIVYHHASGNLGPLHASNFYPNFAPVQELSDWFEHWATEGVKPMFLCEYGAPFTWDWTMYRGWFNGQREFGSARVPWEFCVAEWNAQFFGDRAYQISEAEKANLRWEAKQFRAGNLWHRWDYPNDVGSSRFDERYPVFAMYLTDNWRAFRTWGVSAISPWEHGHFWKLRDGVDKRRKEFAVDWEHLQQPGFSPDYIDQRYERMDLAFERADWVATPAAEALLRNNQPLLAYLGGKPAAFTSKEHNFFPGETVEKQLIVINNWRQTVTCDARWSLGLPQAVASSAQITVPTGDQKRVPLRFELPATLTPGRYELRTSFAFNQGETQQDSFWIDVLSPTNRAAPPAMPGHGTSPNRPRIALFDPRGETSTLLRKLSFSTESVGPDADLSAFDLFIVGKSALSVTGSAPDISRVREGLKVIVFEQSSEVLEKRLGFRAEEYGLRQVFPRVPDHPVLAGLTPENMRDWRGAATLLPPQLKYEMRPRNGPTVQWCGLPVTRVWRCGNRGNVASALIEKPPRGDFLPLLDGGFSLQFSPLLEYREGRGVVLICQLDVTGRTEPEPAAELLVQHIVEYVASWKPAPRRDAVYVGDDAGKKYLDASGLSLGAWEGGKLTANQVLIVGPGSAQKLADQTESLRDWLAAGGHLLAIGLEPEDAARLPFGVSMKRGEHIAAWFEPPALSSILAGISPADVHNRDPRELPLVSGGAKAIGDGVLAVREDVPVEFCQIAPWQFHNDKPMNQKRTYRRAAFLVSRLLANMGVAAPVLLLERFHQPFDPAYPEQRWLAGFYLDQPEEWDDPYRFFRW